MTKMPTCKDLAVEASQPEQSLSPRSALFAPTMIVVHCIANINVIIVIGNVIEKPTRTTKTIIINIFVTVTCLIHSFLISAIFA